MWVAMTKTQSNACAGVRCRHCRCRHCSCAQGRLTSGHCVATTTETHAWSCECVVGDHEIETAGRSSARARARATAERIDARTSCSSPLGDVAAQIVNSTRAAPICVTHRHGSRREHIVLISRLAAVRVELIAIACCRRERPTRGRVRPRARHARTRLTSPLPLPFSAQSCALCCARGLCLRIGHVRPRYATRLRACAVTHASSSGSGGVGARCFVAHDPPAPERTGELDPAAHCGLVEVSIAIVIATVAHLGHASAAARCAALGRSSRGVAYERAHATTLSELAVVAGSSKTRERVVDAAIAIVVETVTSCFRGLIRARWVIADPPRRAAASCRRARAHTIWITERRRWSQALVDVPIAVVVAAITDLRTRRHACVFTSVRRVAVGIDEARKARADSAHSRVTWSDGVRETARAPTHATVSWIGRKQEVFVGASITVVVAHVACFERRPRAAHANHGTTDAGKGARSARTHGVATRGASARIAFVDACIAIIVDCIACLGARPDRPDTDKISSHALFASRLASAFTAATITTPFGVALIGVRVAIVVPSVTNLGGGRDTAHTSNCARDATFDARSALTRVRSAGRAAAGVAFIDETITVVISEIACFGRRCCGNAGIFTSIFRSPVDIEITFVARSNRARARRAARLCMGRATDASTRPAVRDVRAEIEILVDPAVAVIVTPIATSVGRIGGDASIFASIFWIFIEVESPHVARFDLTHAFDTRAEGGQRSAAHVASTAVLERRIRIEAFVDVPVAIVIAFVTTLEPPDDTAIGFFSGVRLSCIGSNEPAAISTCACIVRACVDLTAGQTIRIELAARKRPNEREEADDLRESHRPPRLDRRPRRIEMPVPNMTNSSIPKTTCVRLVEDGTPAALHKQPPPPVATTLRSRSGSTF